MEFEHKDYGGVAKAGLTTGIIGTALGALNGGGLGGLFGGWGNGWNNGGCFEGMPVNHYELNMQKELINRDAEIAFLKGRDQAKSDSLELYRYIDERFRAVEGQIAAQAVTNAQISANLACQQKDIAALMALTKTAIPITNVWPEPMARYNSWTAPTTTAETPTTGG